MNQYINQKGAIPLLVLVAAIAVVSFIAITSTFGFKNKLFSFLFPKPFSNASEAQIAFIDDQGNVITSIQNPTVRVRLHSRWPLPESTASATPSASTTSSPSSTASATLYSKEVVLSENSDFNTSNTITYPFISCTNSGQLNCVDPTFGDFLTIFTFSSSSEGTKVLCAKFVATDNQTKDVLCNTIPLIIPTEPPTEAPTEQPTESPTEPPQATEEPTASPNPISEPSPTLPLNPSLNPHIQNLIYTPQNNISNPSPQATSTSAPDFFNTQREEVIIQNSEQQKEPKFIRPSEPPSSTPNVITRAINNQINPIRSAIQNLFSNLFKTILKLVNR